MSILLTGATGFLGSAIAQNIDGGSLYLLSRKPSNSICVHEYIGNFFDSNCIGDDWPEDVKVIIHCAARAHILKDKIDNPLALFKAVNTEGTLNLASRAAALGVKRFIFLSSIGVNGATTCELFSEADVPKPHNDYALSKFEAEKGLLEIASKTDMEVVIIRPPLVYGPHPPGNFSTLLKLIKKNYILPLASITQNKRSLIAIENLVDFILLCTDYEKTPQAANQVFVISDGEDVSTAELLHRVAKAYGKKSLLFPFPPSLLKLGAKLLRKQDKANQLLGSLQVDSSKARELLGWRPIITMDEQLKKIAEADGFSDLG